MTEAETLSAQLERLRETYDDAIEELTERYGELQSNGHHCWTNLSTGFWPYLLIEGRAGPHQIVTFRGFHYDYQITVPRERFDAFWQEALAHLEGYPEHAYDWQEEAV